MIGSPYIWSHDFALLLPVYLLALEIVRERYGRRAFEGAVIGQFLFGITTIIAPSLEAAFVIAPWIVLGVLWVWHRTNLAFNR